MENKLKEIRSKLTSQPQVEELLDKATAFWRVNGFRVKLGAVVIGLLVLLMVAINIGRNIAGLNQPAERQPAAIPSISPVAEVEQRSVFEGLKTEVTQFSPLLPDPAQPAVDENVTLQKAER